MIAARLRRPFMPWQQHVADVGLELNPDGSLVYGEVDLEVGRQEGKTELKFVVAVTRLTAMIESHGPQIVTYTMQDRKKARTRLERVYAQRLREAAGFREIEAQSRKRPTVQTEWRLGMNSGAETIQFGPASWLQIDTPSRTGGHGDTLDLGLIDEAFAHQDDTVELGMEPAMLTRPDAQLWVLSAAGDARSKYLWRKIVRGRQLVADGADSGVAYFEWSADDDADPSDPKVWAGCCPALGFTVTEAKLEALWDKALKGGPEAVDAFRRSYMCQWPEIPVLNEGVVARWLVFAEDCWVACRDPKHEPTGPLTYGLGVALDGAWSSVGVSDGVHLEIVANRQGTRWVVEDCVAHGVREIALNPASPAGSLIDPLEKANITVRKIKPQEFAHASQSMLTAVIDGTVRHIGQQELDTAAAVADRRDSGEGWCLSQRRSRGDIGPMVAVTCARWASGGGSIYEEHGLVTL